ncbi:hypothetical protein [Nocardiopsis xinjiangensis]|uniref:hypothetical protein n=1 Tax=Nocardiopsis xinjiangensis TaxID=124285 RepID=UPI00034C555E|nr:hypothetical protein [Nocardiopsis xinjiangensis]
MIDPTSFGTALTVLAVIAVLVTAFGLAVLSDMAMRRREDRAATSEQTAKGPDEPTAELPNGLHGAGDLAARAPTGPVAANGREPSTP